MSLIYQAYPVGCKNWVSVRQVLHTTFDDAIQTARWYLKFGHERVKVISIELPTGEEKIIATFNHD